MGEKAERASKEQRRVKMERPLKKVGIVRAKTLRTK